MKTKPASACSVVGSSLLDSASGSILAFEGLDDGVSCSGVAAPDGGSEAAALSVDSGLIGNGLREDVSGVGSVFGDAGSVRGLGDLGVEGVDFGAGF